MGLFQDWLNPVQGVQHLFGFGQGPDEAEGYMNQIPDMLRKYLEPYINRGERGGAAFESNINPMANDPSGYLNKLMGGYSASPGYKLQLEEGLRAAGNTAAAGGMRGSQLDQDMQGRLAQSLMGEDMQRWLNNVLKIQGTGLEGQHSLYGTGFQGANELSQGLGNQLYGKAGLSMQRDAMNRQFFNDLLSGGSKSAGMFMGR